MQIEYTPTVSIQDQFLSEAGVQLSIRREDLNHPTIQGNKYWKLYHNIIKAKQTQATQIITFGGAFSNHILATAAAGQEAGIKTLGIIRGEEPQTYSYTLKQAQSYGMHFHFVSRTDYKRKHALDYQKELLQKLGKAYIIPEGGTNQLAIQGCMEWAKKIEKEGAADYICLPVGTGGSITGLIAGLKGKQKILGFSSLKGNFLQNDVQNLLDKFTEHKENNWNINNDYHFGGYAKFNDELLSFINQFKMQYNIPLDPIYTGKMMYGIYDLIKKGFFKKGSHVLAIHTGGIQGIIGFNERYKNVLV